MARCLEVDKITEIDDAVESRVTQGDALVISIVHNCQYEKPI